MDGWTTLGFVNIGQLGVAIFIAMSGFLAGASSSPPTNWLLRRYWRIFPAFWIVTAASFVLAAIFSHKHFDAWQILSQMLGLGLFTHGDRLINSPTWFISLLLACLVATYFARLSRYPLLVGIAVSLILAFAVATQRTSWLTQHALTYSLATVAALPGHARQRPMILLILAVCLLIAANWCPAFAYGGIALAAVGIGLSLPAEPRWLAVPAEYTYEYYLVHGIILFGANRYGSEYPMLAVLAGILASVAVAAGLHLVIARLDRWALARGKTACTIATT